MLDAVQDLGYALLIPKLSGRSSPMRNLVVLGLAAGLLVLSSVSGALASEAAAPETATGWFPVSAAIQVTPYYASAGVVNVWGAPVACQGSVRAWSRALGPVWSGFWIASILPGSWGYAYVHPGYGDSFLAAEASTSCRYLY
jgi:hypothetical protein